MRIATILMVVALLFTPAQVGGVILVENELHPLPTLFQYDVTVWLENNRPAETHLYAVMNYSYSENGEFVSLAGLDPHLPAPYNWSLMDSTVIWVGSLHRVNGEIQLYQPEQSSAVKSVPHLARMLSSGPGGGVDVYFPWETGKQMFFGERGIHGGGFGVSNAIGLDFVSGDDFGQQAASNVIYASASGTVTAVCEGSFNKGVLIISPANTIGYLHLTPNNPLKEGDVVQRGQALGKLVYGSFSESCGNASQQPDHYHVHWIVIPSNNRYQAEGWALNTGTVEWKRGNETIRMKQWLTGGGGYGSYDQNEDDPATGSGSLVITPGDPAMSGGGGSHLWDYVVLGLNQMYSSFKGYYVPADYSQDENEELFTMAENMARTMIQDWNIILVNDVINLSPWFILAGAIMAGELVRWLMITVVFGFHVVGLLRQAF